MLSFDDSSFEALASEVAFCLANIRHPECSLENAGFFYESAAEALRAHAILRLLVDGNDVGFSNDLIMSAQARRAYLRRCGQAKYQDYFLAFSRSGSFLDAIAADDVDLALELFRASPSAWRPGDEYEDDFCYQRFLGQLLAAAPPEQLVEALAALERAAEGEGARLAVCLALERREPSTFAEAFEELLVARKVENAKDQSLADEQIPAAAGATVFVEGIAVLKVARRLGLPIAAQYPMCPTLALLPRTPLRPFDEFASP